MTESVSLMRPSAEGKEMRSAYDIDVERVIAQTAAIAKVMRVLLISGEHYGVVPGTERFDNGKDVSRPSLFQPGADKLCALFRLRPEFGFDGSIERDDFILIRVRCRLYHIGTGELWGEGIGSANSREAKYANQAMGKVCPSCSKAAIGRSKIKNGNGDAGWYCFPQKQGCGASYAPTDRAITGQVGQVNETKLYDLHNTILKIACKRAKVAGVLCATAASDFFTQDLEDFIEEDAPAGDDQRPQPPAQPQAAQRNASNRKAQPAPQQQGGGATPTQIRDLNMALAEAGVGVDEAEEQGLKGAQREEFITGARLKFCSQALGRDVTAMMDLSRDDVQRALEAARGGGQR